MEIKMHQYPQSNEPFNIFTTLRKESSSLEIFHQGFLASLLSNSSTRYIYDGFLELISCNGEGLNNANIIEALKLELPKIRTEHNANVSGSRVDILLQFERSKTVVAIEVKTVDDSTTKGQLEKYFDLLSREFPGYEVVIIYLTPFNSKNLPDEGGYKNIQALAEYKQFEKYIEKEDSPKGYYCHLNWQQVSQLYKGTANDLLSQHKRYIEEFMCHPDVYRYAVAKRKLEEFVGTAVVERFHQKIDEYGIECDNYNYFSLSKNREKFQELVNVLVLLFEGDGIEKEKTRKDKISGELKEKYRSDYEFAPFFKLLFSELKRKQYVFLEGSGKIGVRVPHRNATQSMSLFTISPEAIVIKEMESNV